MTTQSTDRTSRIGDVGIKAPVKASSTAALTLSGEQTINGVACVTGDRVLVKDQASSIDNGIYVVDTGEWTRAVDCDGSYDLADGTLVNVTDGTQAGYYYADATNPVTVGSSAIAFGRSSTTLATVSAFMQTVLDDTTAAAARASLGSTTAGDAVFVAATAAAGRSALSAAGSGATTASGLTMATARLLGRTTASTGAIEEITVGTGLTLSAGSLTASVASATQAEMEAASSTTVFATPGNLAWHPGMAKAWLRMSTSGGTPTLGANRNVSSITDNGAGDFTANFTTAFSSSTAYMMVGTSQLAVPNSNTPRAAMVHTYAAGSCRFTTDGGAGTPEDNHAHTAIAFFGDQ